MNPFRRRRAPEPHSRDEIIAQRQAHSRNDFMKHGPRLACDRKSYVLARGDGRVLIGGLGSFGHGTMWEADGDIIQQDATYADAPYDPDRRDDFGSVGR